MLIYFTKYVSIECGFEGLNVFSREIAPKSVGGKPFHCAGSHSPFTSHLSAEKRNHLHLLISKRQFIC
ncbi:hypothetical protein CDAR_223831 [Caerostris darwini]|uniref:Ycf15 n=1 Tax=Caerostris darwini TaxID=1538125 RepID=A0AAV4RVX4_9ARAC|nr:hypothetical protein CDAR_223831 [Caerostris darwini]